MKSVSTSYGLGTKGHVLSRSYCIGKRTKQSMLPMSQRTISKPVYVPLLPWLSALRAAWLLGTQQKQEMSSLNINLSFLGLFIILSRQSWPNFFFHLCYLDSRLARGYLMRDPRNLPTKQKGISLEFMTTFPSFATAQVPPEWLFTTVLPAAECIRHVHEVVGIKGNGHNSILRRRKRGNTKWSHQTERMEGREQLELCRIL